MQQVADLGSPAQPVSEATFADLLQPLIEPGFRLALAMLHDPGSAEDAVQEASFVAWRKLGRMRDRGRLRGWFLGIVANKCRNTRRLKWTSGVATGVPEHIAVVSGEDMTLRGADLRRAIAKLGHDDRLVIALYFYLDLPVEEVATIAGSSVGATRAPLSIDQEAATRPRPRGGTQVSLRRDVHFAFDGIAPPLGGMPERVVQTVLADHIARRRKERMLIRLRTPLSLVAVLLLIALVAAGFVGGRVLQQWSSFHNSSPAGVAPMSPLAQLEARPLHLPKLKSVLDCKVGPLNSEGDFGAGPVFAVGGPNATTRWASYFYADFYANSPIEGPILIRIKDLFKPAPTGFVGTFAAGKVLGNDTLNGQPIQLRSEAVLYAGKPSTEVPGGWIAPTNPHPYVWYVMSGARNDFSASTGWQIDGLNFSEVFLDC